MPPLLKKCSGRCGRSLLATSEFFHLDGRKARCKKCISEDNRKWYLNNRAAHAEYMRGYREDNAEAVRVMRESWRLLNPVAAREGKAEWKASNPERNREHSRRYRVRKLGADGGHTAQEWLKLKETFAFCCVGCGKHESACGPLTEDHIVPLSVGGSDYIENIQPLCVPCNSRKWTHPDLDYRQGALERLGLSG